MTSSPAWWRPRIRWAHPRRVAGACGSAASGSRGSPPGSSTERASAGRGGAGARAARTRQRDPGPARSRADPDADRCRRATPALGRDHRMRSAVVRGAARARADHVPDPRSGEPALRGSGPSRQAAVHASSSSTGRVLTIRSIGTLALGRARAAVLLPVQLTRRVPVGVDAELAPGLDRLAQQPPRRVQPLRAAVDLHRDPVLDAGRRTPAPHRTCSPAGCRGRRSPAAPCSARGCRCAGSRCARIIRRVIAPDSDRSLECTEATTMSTRPSSSSVWSSVPSSLMSHSMPVSSRNGARCGRSRSMMSSCFSSRSGLSPLATVSRGEWSVMARYSWPSSMAVTAISSIGLPPSLHVVCACRSPRSAARISSPPVASGTGPLLQVGQVSGHLARERLAHHRGRLRADALEVRQSAGGRPACPSPRGRVPASAIAAVRNAFTRYVGARSRSSRKAIRRSAAIGSTGRGYPHDCGRRSSLTGPPSARDAVAPSTCARSAVVVTITAGTPRHV